MSNDVKCSLSLEVRFKSPREADIAHNSLVVDDEPPRSKVTKSITPISNQLHCKFTSNEISSLRASINSFMDSLILIQKTIDKFDVIPTSNQ